MRQKKNLMGTFVYRCALGSLILLLFGVMAALGFSWVRTNREYTAFLERQRDTQARLDRLREEHEQREAYLRAFLQDPEFVERVVRERLGYVKPGETLYRFRD